MPSPHPVAASGAERPVRSQYEDFMRHVRDHGVAKADRTGTGTRSVFGYQMRFDLREGFPLVTTKKVHLRSIILELLWFLRGDGNARWLQERGVTIWDEWAGPTATSARCTACSGARGRRPTAATSTRSPTSSSSCAPTPTRAASSSAPGTWPTCRRWRCCRATRSSSSTSRRPWAMRGRALSCQLYQRSADIFLGVPFNIASYALLTHMLAQQCDLDVGDFVWTGGDCHIYSNHAEQVELQLSRAPLPVPDARRSRRRPASIFDYELEDFAVLGYESHPRDQGAGGRLRRAFGGRRSVPHFTPIDPHERGARR